ncbi:MAG: 23S rRNA (guanosine(2251)-2'-O)-methyltransferase RlmB [Firmicutes bacterium]|nr:23S rRNA (guanosine(2251)-2'-O)-methyltransferase RlmB [Bacillota bacterium]
MKEKSFVIGKNSVLESLKFGTINYILSSRLIPAEILTLAKQKGIVIKNCNSKILNSICRGKNHQGIVAQISSRKYFDVDDILCFADKENKPAFILILDKISDPQNFGSIIRTAEFMGVHGIIIRKRGAVAITPTVEKSSSGALEHIMISRVGSLVRVLDFLKKKGIWICGTDSCGENFHKFSNFFKSPVALVIGSEGDGMSRLVKDKCDFILSIPLLGKTNSLNASVAAGIFIQKVVEERSK